MYFEMAAQKLDGETGSHGVTHVERSPRTAYQKRTKIKSDMKNVKRDINSTLENLGTLIYYQEKVNQKLNSIHMISIHLVKFTVQLLSVEMLQKSAVNSTTKEQAKSFVKEKIKTAIMRGIGAQLRSCKEQSTNTNRPIMETCRLKNLDIQFSRV